MQVVRSFPDPDPVMRFLDEEEVPQSVWLMPAQERAQRVRYALIGLCAGLEPVLAWEVALASDEESEERIAGTLRVVTDEDIEDMVRSARAAQRAALD